MMTRRRNLKKTRDYWKKMTDVFYVNPSIEKERIIKQQIQDFWKNADLDGEINEEFIDNLKKSCIYKKK